MSEQPRKLFLTSSLLTQFPFLVHGFGTRYLDEDQIRSIEPGKNLNLVTMKQEHSDRILFLGRELPSSLRGDALVTNQTSLLLVVKTADCLPVLLVDAEQKIIAAAHCGWRGTASQLLSKLVAFIAGKFRTRPQDLRVALGPCISADCYEVGEEVREIFGQAGFSLDEDLFRPNPQKPNFYYLDLRLANKKQLLASGVNPENIEEVGDCPHCSSDFVSWRRDRDKTGRLLNFIGLRPSF